MLKYGDPQQNAFNNVKGENECGGFHEAQGIKQRILQNKSTKLRFLILPKT